MSWIKIVVYLQDAPATTNDIYDHFNPLLDNGIYQITEWDARAARKRFTLFVECRRHNPLLYAVDSTGKLPGDPHGMQVWIFTPGLNPFAPVFRPISQAA